jgi:hypothetical protein
MSLLSIIIKGNTTVPAKQLAYLIAIIKKLGWNSLNDSRTIKPDLDNCQHYISKHSSHLEELFDTSFLTKDKNDIVDIINPFLIKMWHIQIIGTIDAASIELLRPVTNNLDIINR